LLIIVIFCVLLCILLGIFIGSNFIAAKINLEEDDSKTILEKFEKELEGLFQRSFSSLENNQNILEDVCNKSIIITIAA